MPSSVQQVLLSFKAGPTVTRLYFSNAAIPYDPATERGAWDTTDYTGIKLGAKSGSATTRARAEVSTTNNFDMLLLKAVSDGLPSGVSISGTVEWCIGAVESGAGANSHIHVHIFVTQGDSDSLRGTLLTDNIDPTELNTTAQGETIGATAISTVVASAGDRIVVEIGVQHQNTSSSSFTSTLDYGGTGGTDLTDGSTSTTTQPGWIEFSTSLGL